MNLIMKKIKKLFKLSFAWRSEIVLFLLAGALFLNLIAILPDLLSPFKPTQFQLLLPREEKLRVKLGWFYYDYIQFIKRQTPEDAVVLVPPQGFPWPATGNVAYLRYFLYPRYLINGDERESRVDLKKEGVEYVLLDWGESRTEYDYTQGWPKFWLPAKRIIYKKELSYPGDFEAEVVEKDYDPGDPINFKKWGVIELDQERL